MSGSGLLGYFCYFRFNSTFQQREGLLDDDGYNDDNEVREKRNVTQNRGTPPAKVISASVLDRPSHWGASSSSHRSGANAGRRASLPLPSKSTKASQSVSTSKQNKARYSLGSDVVRGVSTDSRMITGSIAHFPPAKVQLDAENEKEGEKRVATVSFRPSWVGISTSDKKSSSECAKTNRRQNDQEDIQDDEHDQEGRNDSFEFGNMTTAETVDVHSPRSSSYRGTAHIRDVNSSNQDEDQFMQPFSGSSWISPPSSSKRGGKGYRRAAPAGSLRALFQKVQRKIQEKESRIINIKNAARTRDPMDPRNKATSMVDIVVVMEEGGCEKLPFRVAVVCVVDTEFKERKPLIVLQSSGSDLNTSAVPIGTCGRGDGDLNFGQSVNGILNREDLANEFHREGENGTSNDASAACHANSGNRQVKVADRDHTIDVCNFESLRPQQLTLNTLSRGTFLRAYFKADSFKGDAGTLFGKGCVLRVYEPELQRQGLAPYIGKQNQHNVDLQEHLIEQLARPGTAVALDLIFRTFDEMCPAACVSSLQHPSSSGGTVVPNNVNAFPMLLCTQLVEPLDTQF